MSQNLTYRTITREKFLFHEMRITARLMQAGKTDAEIKNTVANENLYQYPTERMIRSMVSTCLKRLHALDSMEAVAIIAEGSVLAAKQTCFYSMMKQNMLIWDFMTTVIAEKYRTKNFNYSQRDLNAFFSRLQEQNNEVASWSDETVKRCKIEITKILLETEYLESRRSEKLNPVLIEPDLKQIMVDKKDSASLAAFNCFEEV